MFKYKFVWVLRIQVTIYAFPQQENECVTATSQIYAHKKRPSVFMQEYRIHNPSVSNIVCYLEKRSEMILKTLD